MRWPRLRFGVSYLFFIWYACYGREAISSEPAGATRVFEVVAPKGVAIPEVVVEKARAWLQVDKQDRLQIMGCRLKKSSTSRIADMINREMGLSPLIDQGYTNEFSRQRKYSMDGKTLLGACSSDWELKFELTQWSATFSWPDVTRIDCDKAGVCETTH